jgi:uncharacterized coiled-coil protein SlyX
MSLEARVQVLEDRQVEWDKVLTGIEGTVALILKEQIDLKKQVNLRLDAQDRKLDALNVRFDQLELLIRQSLPAN